jgi:pimeloyl-ACP methyl ester carboxylesterase
VAKFTRVCTYDRAGLGWSELSPAPRTASNIVNELYTLLGRAGVEPPYVLVGHSIGGLFVRVYAHEHPEQVAGMVLVDASHDEQEVRVPEAIARMNKSGYRSMAWGFRLLQMLSSLGLLALLGEKARHMWPSPIPQEARDTYLGVAYSSAHHLEAAARESTSLQENLSTARARPIRSLGDIPLIVVSAGQLGLSAGHGISTADVEQMKVAHDGMQAELATLSTRGKCVIAQESSHYVQVSQPALVVDAIREVVEAARR